MRSTRGEVAELVEVRAGLVGIEQRADGALRPVAAWAVCPGIEVLLWSRLEAQHETTAAARGAPEWPRWDVTLCDRTFHLFYERFDGASLFGGALVLLSSDEVIAEAARVSGPRCCPANGCRRRPCGGSRAS